jgi:cysteine desulfurase/selenocysteine lyase
LSIDITHIRKEFPILHQEVNGYPLVYLDSAATTQKPQIVINAIEHYYKFLNANIHRGAHYLANLSTVKYEDSREKVRAFLNAEKSEEIIFTSGTTDGINLVAQTWGRQNIQAGDEIVLSMLEHHSNIVPWQMLAEEKGAVIRVIPIHESGEWDLTQIDTIISAKTKMVAVNHVSNALGTINQIDLVIARADAIGAKVLIDGAQSVAHFPVDVQSLNCDFYVFSAHKIYGATGTGVLYGKSQLLEAMPPWRGGGEMIKSVSFEKTTYNELPFKFEAGTPNIEGVIALGEAIDFVSRLDWNNMQAHDMTLLNAATSELMMIDGLRIFGTAANKVGVLSLF